VQLILAGKAHPADQAGQALIQEWMHFIRQPRPAHVMFLSDYDMQLTERLYRAWTSGSTRHGGPGGERHKRHEGTHKWRRQSLRTGRLVAEAYTPEVGWR